MSDEKTRSFVLIGRDERKQNGGRSHGRSQEMTPRRQSQGRRITLNHELKKKERFLVANFYEKVSPSVGSRVVGSRERGREKDGTKYGWRQRNKKETKSESTSCRSRRNRNC